MGVRLSERASVKSITGGKEATFVGEEIKSESGTGSGKTDHPVRMTYMPTDQRRW
jgi:hypothetical protein